MKSQPGHKRLRKSRAFSDTRSVKVAGISPCMGSATPAKDENWAGRIFIGNARTLPAGAFRATPAASNRARTGCDLARSSALPGLASLCFITLFSARKSFKINKMIGEIAAAHRCAIGSHDQAEPDTEGHRSGHGEPKEHLYDSGHHLGPGPTGALCYPYRRKREEWMSDFCGVVSLSGTPAQKTGHGRPCPQAEDSATKGSGSRY